VQATGRLSNIQQFACQQANDDPNFHFNFSILAAVVQGECGEKGGE